MRERRWGVQQESGRAASSKAGILVRGGHPRRWQAPHLERLVHGHACETEKAGRGEGTPKLSRKGTQALVQEQSLQAQMEARTTALAWIPNGAANQAQGGFSPSARSTTTRTGRGWGWGDWSEWGEWGEVRRGRVGGSEEGLPAWLACTSQKRRSLPGEPHGWAGVTPAHPRSRAARRCCRQTWPWEKHGAGAAVGAQSVRGMLVEPQQRQCPLAAGTAAAQHDSAAVMFPPPLTWGRTGSWPSRTPTPVREARRAWGEVAQAVFGIALQTHEHPLPCVQHAKLNAPAPAPAPHRLPLLLL